MNQVIDASAFIHFARRPEKAPESLKNRIAPTLLTYEIGNTLWKEATLYRHLTREKTQRLLHLYRNLLELMNLREPEPSRTLELAHSHGITYYDASYLALAEQTEAELVTADNRLASKVVGCPVKVVLIEI